MITLIFDSTAVSFGAVGTPVQMALSLLPKEVGTAGFIAGISFWTALPHAVVAAKKNFLTPKNTWDFGDKTLWDEEWRATGKVSPVKESDMPLLLAWVPYLLIAVILVVTRIPQLGIKGLLTGGAPFVISVKNILGSSLNWSLKWAYLPGTFFILTALLTNVMHKMDKAAVRQSWKDTFGQVSGAAIAIIFGLALVQVLSFSPAGSDSMMRTMALGLSQVGRFAYVVMAPFIGVLGAFVSGSATVSMTLFTNLQYDTASALNVAPAFAVAMQCVGAAIGNMVCINNAVAASATIGVTGREGKLIKLNVTPMLIYTFTTIAIFMVVIFLLNLQPCFFTSKRPASWQAFFVTA